MNESKIGATIAALYPELEVTRGTFTGFPDQAVVIGRTRLLDALKKPTDLKDFLGGFLPKDLKCIQLWYAPGKDSTDYGFWTTKKFNC